MPEGIRLVTLLQEFFLAAVTPCLKIIGVIAVLDESGRCRLTLEQVLADDSRDPFSVRPTIHSHWLSDRHIQLCGLTLKLTGGSRAQRVDRPVERFVGHQLVHAGPCGQLTAELFRHLGVERVTLPYLFSDEGDGLFRRQDSNDVCQLVAIAENPARLIL